MEQSATSSFIKRGKWYIRIALVFSIVLCGGLLLQRHLQQYASMRTFRRQSAQVAAMLGERINSSLACGSAHSLGISSLRLKGVIEARLPEDCDSLLRSFTQVRRHIGADIVFAMNARGRVVISTRDDEGRHFTGNNYAFRPYFQAAMEGRSVVYAALGATTFERGLYHASPVFADAPGQAVEDIIGVVVIKMPFTDVDRMLTRFADIIALVNPHGIVLSSSVAEWRLQRIDDLRRIPESPDGASANPEYDSDYFRSRSSSLPLKFSRDRVRWENRNYAALAFPIHMNDPDGDWTLLVMRDPSAWFAKDQILLNMAVLLALCLAMSIAAYAFRRRRLAEAATVKAAFDAAQTYRSIFNSATDALFVHDAETGLVLDANDSARKLYGYTGDDLKALTPDGDFPYPPAVARPALKAAMENRTQIITFQSRSRTGRAFWAQATFRSYIIHGTPRILANVHDITEQRAAHSALSASKKMLEQEVEVRTQQFLQAQKMAAIGKFAERITHDVTNTMTRILGYTEIIRGRPGQADVLNSSLDEISAAASEMCKFSSELLAFAHPVPLALTPMNLCRVVEGFETVIRASAPSQVKILFCIPKTPLRVKLSPNHIEQALTHLAQNGFESMQNAGTLTITLRRGESDDRPPSAEGQPDPEQLALIEVTDSGAGFAPEYLPHVFDPFFTTKNDSKRRGMGLTTVYIIVNSHHGWVTVLPASTGGGGVQIWLPLISDEPGP